MDSVPVRVEEGAEYMNRPPSHQAARSARIGQLKMSSTRCFVFIFSNFNLDPQIDVIEKLVQLGIIDVATPDGNEALQFCELRAGQGSHQQAVAKLVELVQQRIGTQHRTPP